MEKGRRQARTQRGRSWGGAGRALMPPVLGHAGSRSTAAAAACCRLVSWMPRPLASPPPSAEHGDFFGIGVSGYPEAHPDVIVEDGEEMKKNYWADIDYLKKKVG